VAATQETVRYWGETEAQRDAAFRPDSVARGAAGWRVLSQTTEWPFGKLGLDLVVTYERNTPEPSTPPYPVAASARDAPEILRYVRRGLVIGGVIAWSILALSTGAGLGGVPKPGQLPWLADSCAIQSVAAFGLAWSLALWHRIPILVRVIGIGFLAFFMLGSIGLGLTYASGQAP
jgi:hypothetical protein